MEEIVNPAGGATETPTLNFVQRLTGVYFSPQKTFDDIGRRGGWIGMFLIAAVLACGSYYVLRSRMDPETFMRKSLQASPFTRSLSEEQIKVALERAQNQGPVQRSLAYVFIPIVVLVTYVIVAAAFLLVFVIMGGALNFKKSLAMTVWGMGPPGIVAVLLSVLFMYVKDPDTLEINAPDNVVSNLGLLVSQQEHPAIASLLSSIDIFSFWTIFLLGLGFAAASEGRLTAKKATTGVVVLWAIYVLGKFAFKSIF